MEYFMPTRLHTGSACLANHPNDLRNLGASCLVVSDKTAARASGALSDAEQVLDACNIAHQLWDGVSANPPVSACIEAGAEARACNAEFIMGIGGGSSLDAAKAIAVFAATPTLDEAGFYGMKWENDPLPIALVGTTAGTGSEVTKVSVLTDSASRKHSIHDDRLYATVAFGDSRHTYSCPAAVTLSCGVDVLAHATESYFSHKADEISRAFAVRAIRLALGPLAAAVAGELAPEQRDALYEASILGGLAINTTGTCFPHNVGYYLTETYGIPHGFASAVFMPAMLEMAAEFDHAYADAFYTEIGMSKLDYMRLVTSCLPAYDVQMDENEIAAALPRWRDNGSVKNTRAKVELEDIRSLLTCMFVPERGARTGGFWSNR